MLSDGCRGLLHRRVVRCLCLLRIKNPAVKARIVEIVSNGMLNAFSSKYEKENGAKGGMRPVSTPRCPVKADITISPKSTRLKIIVVIATSKVRNTREAAGL